MTNILPPDAHKKMTQLTRARYTIVTSTVLCLAAVVVYGALLPSYLVLYLNPGTTTLPASVSRDEIATDKADLIHAQLLLNAFAPSVAPVTPTDAIAAALSVRPQGIHVDHITYTAGKTGTIILQGSADTIDAIGAYRAALLADKKFSQVDVPVGVLVGSENGRFDVTLSGDF